MNADFSKIFHRSSQDHRKGHQPIAVNPDEWPPEWRTTYYKSYPRLPKIALNGTLSFVTAPNMGEHSDFFQLVRERKSQRNFKRDPISLKELSMLLQYSCGTTGLLEDGRHRRAQPSGGGRFPIEVCPIVFRGSDIPAGLYHYNVKEHALDALWAREFSDTDINQLFTYEWVRNAAAVFIMTAVFSRNQHKYGERGYRYVLLEAGHIGQNVYLAAEALGLKCCALAGTRDEALERLIDIDGITESVVYAVAIGR